MFQYIEDIITVKIQHLIMLLIKSCNIVSQKCNNRQERSNRHFPTARLHSLRRTTGDNSGARPSLKLNQYPLASTQSQKQQGTNRECALNPAHRPVLPSREISTKIGNMEVSNQFIDYFGMEIQLIMFEKGASSNISFIIHTSNPFICLTT